MKVLSKITSSILNLRTLKTEVSEFGIKDGVSIVRRGLYLGKNKRHNIYYNGKKIGKVNFTIYKHNAMPQDMFPANWYGEDLYTIGYNSVPLKKYMWVNKLIIFDQYNKPAIVKRNKKFGTMTLQALLNYAIHHGCESRIGLMAARLGKNGHSPNAFYAKIGFVPRDFTVKYLEEAEKKYLAKQQELLNSGLNIDEVSQKLSELGLFLPQKINGNYVTEGDNIRLFLGNKNQLINYQI